MNLFKDERLPYQKIIKSNKSICPILLAEVNAVLDLDDEKERAPRLKVLKEKYGIIRINKAFAEIVTPA